MAGVKDNLIEVEEGEQKEEADGPTAEVVGGYYTIPMFRFTIIIQTLLVFDLCSTLALWLTGGDTDYMEKNVTNFNIWDSIFDLAVLAFVRVSILFFTYHCLEKVTIQQIDNPNDTKLSSKKGFCHAVVILLSIGSLAYSITKGVLIYHVLGEERHKMHVTYYALVISAMSFCFLETLFALGSFSSMKKLKRLRVLHTPEGKKEEKKKVNLKRLMTLAIPEIGLLSVGSFALLVSSGSQVAAPYFFGLVIQASVASTMAKLNTTVLILFGIYCVGAVAAFTRAYLFTLAGQRLVARIRKSLFNAILSQEVAFFDTNRTGELINRLSSDTQVIQNCLTVNVSMLLRYSVQILGSLILMFILSPKLAAVLISIVPIVGIGAQIYGKFVQGLQKKFQDELAAASTTAEESIGNVRTVRSFSQEKKSMNLYGADIDKSFRIGAKLALSSGGFNGFVNIIGMGAVTLVLWYGGKLVHQGELQVGLLTAFMLYTLNVAMAFAFLSSLYGDFMKAVGASFRIFELMDRVPAINMEGGERLPDMNRAISFRDVFFHYPSRPDTVVLKNLSFKIKPGDTVALVGPSGGGKSTVISLIERFYDPVSGTINVGDTDMAALDLTWMRRRIAMVSQEPVLFATTIAENIAYGRDATQHEIEEAAKQANAHDFIQSFDEGYETQVGERGIKLSGGQKQRVAIARALLMDPEVLLLDEATSALDAESEHLVKEAIDRAMKSRTVLVIAHRLSTVRSANSVIVIDQGRIVERGTHKELLELGGVYKKLVLRQLSTGSHQGAGNDLAGRIGDNPHLLEPTLEENEDD